MIDTIKEALGLRTGRLRPYELAVIDSCVKRLPSAVGATLQAQVNDINRVQRLGKACEVNLYKIVGGKPRFDDRLRYPGRQGAEILATVWLRRPETRARIKVDLHLVEGRLFSLTFNQPPAKFFAGHDLHTFRPEVDEVRIWLDPTVPTSEVKPLLQVPEAVGSWLQNASITAQPENLLSPLNGPARALRFEQLDAKLPDDYVELTLSTEGLSLGGLVVFGLSQIRVVVLDDGNHYMIVELESVGALTVKEGTTDARLYFHSYEEQSATDMGTALGSAIRRLLDRRP